MTDDERRDAERADFMDVNDFESGLKNKAIYTDEVLIGWLRNTFDFAWASGYAAACEAKRAEDRPTWREKYWSMREVADSMGEQLDAERSRSAKLIAALHRLTSRETMTVPLSPNHPSTMIWDELTARVRFAYDTLKEYEATRD